MPCRRYSASRLLYGATVYRFMNFLMPPLSGGRTMALTSPINGVLALMFFMGSTISFLVLLCPAS
jgi:hypothetical protein